ncbi:type I secretion system permease/ATPase [Tabrizicola fusiformis]|uniref:type I secretion system permease/ATPase n=1 Tax=Tabrizicola sp. SY72 TaxID=2741673 RepID=UPI001572B9DD|nr:type I secretion system permease/ATPase [Tabrizicola sp. SY72]NTT87797.1 type I secretion system permease/ATPase [Tabrizicola sp. SY72]
MRDEAEKRGRAELSLRQGGLLAAVGLFSVAINILLLTGPLYMLQVYDRVLASRSEATLVALSLLVAFLFITMGVLEYSRGRILARIGAQLQDRLDYQVFSAAHRRLVQAPGDPAALAAQRDLEALQRFWASPVVSALFDAPWTPLFLAAIFVFHPMLGWLSLGGGALLVALTWLNQRVTGPAMRRVNAYSLEAERRAEDLKSSSATLLALGMTGSAFARWSAMRRDALAEAMSAADRGGTFGALTRTLRMGLQSAVLGLGAWLVLRNELSAGAMIAGSILMGRCLQPIEQMIGQWGVVTRALEGHQRLAGLLGRCPPEAPRIDLPRPAARIEALNLTVFPPGEQTAVLRGVSFRMEPGQAIGVIGPSGAGKSSLARALTGIWPAAGGTVRLDGATPDQFGPDRLGRLIGYLPQSVALFDGTIAENIARLDPNPDSAAVVAAAQRAAAHEMIKRLPQGYETRVSALAGRLSGGQLQRIGLARALYGNPVFLVLDEPNSNLDNDGTVALNTAIREQKAAGGGVLIMAHRPAAIQECDMLLVLEEGVRRAFGPRDQVLRDMVRNHTELVRNPGPGGVA